MCNMKFLLFLIYYFACANCQLAKMLDLAERADNCRIWSAWGNCIWVKGNEDKDPQWNKPVFDQMEPDCKDGYFYGSLRQRYKAPIENGLQYLRNITRDVKPCGQWSYRHSCGYQCTTQPKPDFSYINRFFTAEKLCTPEDLDGWSQETACSAEYDSIPKECKLWPDNPNFNMSSIDEKERGLANSVELFSCLKSKGLDGRPKCRCCCFPYKPDPKDWKCKKTPWNTPKLRQSYFYLIKCSHQQSNLIGRSISKHQKLKLTN